MSDFKLSVVIPAYNCERYIIRTLKSIIAQNINDMEIIVVDDCSTDNTKGVILEFNNSSLLKARLISHDINKKQGAARNTGFAGSSGEFVFFMDADDTLAEGCFAHLLDIADQKEAECVSFGVQVIEKDGKVTPFHSWEFESKGGVEGVHLFSQYKIGAIGCNKMFKADFLRKNNLTFIENYFHEDIIFTAYLSFICKKYISIPEVYLNYHQNETSTMNKKPQKAHLSSYFNVYKELTNFLRFLENEGINDPALFKRLSYAYGSAEVFPKIKRYAQTKSKNDFEADIFEAAVDVLGVIGFPVADSVNTIYRKEAK